MKKVFKGNQSAWSSFLKPTINTLAPAIGIFVGAKSKNPQVAQATTKNLRIISGGKNSSLTDLHGIELRLEVIQIISKKISY